MKLLGAVIAVVVLLAFGWNVQQDLGPAPVATGVETTSLSGAAPTPAVAGGGEKYWDYSLEQKISKDALPFFLRPYQQFGPDSDPLERAQEVYRAIYDVRPLTDTPSISFGYTVTSKWTVGKKEIEVRYPNLHLVNGEIVWDTANGPLYLAEQSPLFPKLYDKYLAGEYTKDLYLKARQILSREEFKKIDQFLYRFFYLGLRDHNKLYLEFIRDARAKARARFGIKDLDIKLPWAGDITLAQVLNLELYSPEEYMPDVIYFGQIDAWGYCIAGPIIPVNGQKPERRIAINPQAVVFDWVLGKRSVVYHELAHSIQGFPLFWYVDCELLNELLTNAIDAFELDFLYHSYLARLRAIAYRHFHFDARYARDYVVKYRVGGIIEFDRDRFLEMSQYVRQLHEELRTLVKRAYELFYSDPLFWITLGDQMKDDAMFLDVVAALMYPPASINGSPEETIKWCKENEAKIMEIGAETLKEMAQKHRERKETEDYPTSILALSWWNSLPPEARQVIMEAYQNGGIDAVVDLFLAGGDNR